MSYQRRSRKGKIHLVRERVKKGYRYASGTLRDANELSQYFASGLARDLGKGLKGIRQDLGIPSGNRVKTLIKGIDQTKDSFNRGANSIHKSSQLLLAKGHQKVQSGLKKAQKLTGDFNMYQRNSYYQYQPPVAMFSMAEVDKYNRHTEGMANFASFGGGKYGPKPQSQLRQDLGKAGRGLKSAPGAAWRGVKGAAVGSYKLAGRGASGGYGLARKGVAGGYGLARKGVAGGIGLAGAGANKLGSAAATGLGMGSVGMAKLSDLAGRRAGRTGALIAGAAALGAAGAGATMFTRRRRTKTGKVVVEQVRR